MSMRYGKDGESLLCEHCYARENPKKEVRSDQNKKKYVCNTCSYKFGLKPGKKVLCPYCGSTDVEDAAAFSADNLLKESVLGDRKP